MGVRNYAPGMGSFTTRDMYAGSGADMALTSDPFSGGTYAFGDANPISNIELDGHMPCIPGGPCGSVQALGQYELTAELNAMRDAALSTLSAVFKAQQPQEPSLGSMVCQALLDLCQLPQALGNIPHIPSELKQFGSWWLAGWRAGYSNKPVAWHQNGKLNVTTPWGAVFQFAGIQGASSGRIQNTSKPIYGEYPDYGQTSLYMITDPATGKILKFGITNDPAGRYDLGDYAAWNSEYGGNFQMNILKNFDTRDDALTVERALTSQAGGPENDEPWANSEPTDSPWDQLLKDALSGLGEGEG